MLQKTGAEISAGLHSEYRLWWEFYKILFSIFLFIIKVLDSAITGESIPFTIYHHHFCSRLTLLLCSVSFWTTGNPIKSIVGLQNKISISPDLKNQFLQLTCYPVILYVFSSHVVQIYGSASWLSVQ